MITNETKDSLPKEETKKAINPKIDELIKVEKDLNLATARQEELNKAKEQNEATKKELEELKTKIAELKAKREEIISWTKKSLWAEKNPDESVLEEVKYEKTPDEKERQSAQKILVQFNENPEKVDFQNVEWGILWIVLGLLKAFFWWTWQMNSDTWNVENTVSEPEEIDEKLEPIKIKPEKKLTSNEEKERKEKFLIEAKQIALEIQWIYWIPWEVTVWQAILESNRWKSQLSSKHNNYFWIKSFSNKDESVSYKTNEHRNWKNVIEVHKFKKFNTMREWFIWYAEFLTKNPRYKNAFKYWSDLVPKPSYYPSDYKWLNTYKFIYEISKAWYATDTKYADKVVSTFDNMNNV